MRKKQNSGLFCAFGRQKSLMALGSVQDNLFKLLIVCHFDFGRNLEFSKHQDSSSSLLKVPHVGREDSE